ncbi:MAG TPA: mechanosensitive ion channel domain-containing protein, partial [Candidatus Limnocylindrales bacterium]|nr:mechanosensitive ion channel domain-containing protein [Candidatus Limnocylindrales bacterium]
MKAFQRVAFAASLMLGVLALAGLILARYWLRVPQPARTTAAEKTVLVDEQPLVTARALAALAATPEEQEFAQQAVHVADHEVDLAFAAALRKATAPPEQLSDAAKKSLARVEEIQERIGLLQADIAGLEQSLAKAPERRKPNLQGELQFQKIQLELSQEELEAARQELIRQGGDQRSKVQRLMEQHEAWSQAQAASAGTPPGNGRPNPETDASRTVLVQFRAWRQLATKETSLVKAIQETTQTKDHLEQEHAALVKKAGQAEAGATLKQVAEDQRDLAELDKRIQDLKQLEGIYQSWNSLVGARKWAYALGVAEGAVWVMALLLLAIFANRLVRSVLSRVAPESRRLRTAEIVACFVVQVTALGLVLLVVFGPPNQLATVLALAGAGLTVALKDFIVGFFGWFVLMGRNGIRPGDWVEINGVGGEVLEVGLLHTVLLETGNWSDAGHPTGRKVTFVNSFAIEGHYFNFSTTGQWLWDEIEVPLPPGEDPYSVADAVQQAVTEETQANIRLAREEWQRVVPGQSGRSFSATPAISVRPTSIGVNVMVRY